MSYVSIDVDLDDILYGMSGWEKQKLAENLYNNGYVPEEVEKAEKRKMLHAAEDEYQTALEKLNGKWNRLTPEEEEFIINISKRF